MLSCSSQQLENVIKAKIPGIQSLINKTVLELETELSRLGKPIAADAGVCVLFFFSHASLFYQFHSTGSFLWRSTVPFCYLYTISFWGLEFSLLRQEYQ